eukprot:5242805-Alexandrium_andersonii.AAC.1
MAAGGFFMLENPACSAAWEAVAALRQLRRSPGVLGVVFDQCCLGLVDASGIPHRKRTRIVTNCKQLVEALKSCQCDRSHKHSWVIGGAKVSRRAGHYPPKIAEAV